VANQSNSVGVLLGNGDGTFQPAVNFGVGSSPASVAVGDFNGDGKADLAVANYGSNNVSVLLGKGDGTFQPAVNLSVGLNPLSVAVGDFNGDGRTDLAVANSLSNSVSVLLGVLTGCTYAINQSSASVAAAGTSGTVSVTAPAGCPWTAISGATWLTITAGASGSGNGTVAYTAAPNATVLWQTATLPIAGQTFTVTQAPPVATNTEAFVRQLYLDLLSRPADPSGLSTWVNWINTGVYTRAQVASQFFQSQEFYGTGNYTSPSSTWGSCCAIRIMAAGLAGITI